jgi:hypothetical protein
VEGVLAGDGGQVTLIRRLDGGDLSFEPIEEG